MNKEQLAGSTTERLFTLQLSFDQVNIALKGLGELKAKHSVPLINNIHLQIAPQLAEKQAEE